MAREQKTKSKASQRSKQRVAATQATQTIADATADDTLVTNNTTTTNTSDTTISTQPEQVAVEQSSTSNQPVASWPGLQPSWQSWPTSKPGPRATPPIPGARPINSLRPEQFKEIGYNQQTGEPATQSPLPDEHTTGPTSFDQPTAQNAPGKGKQRL